MKQNVVNCFTCGNLFNSLGRTICMDCKRKEDEAANGIRKFLKKNPDASANNVCEEVGVSMELLSRLIDQGRVIMKRNESPLSCQICNQKIVKGKVCAACAGQLSEGFGKSETEKQQVTTRYFNKKR